VSSMSSPSTLKLKKLTSEICSADIKSYYETDSKQVPEESLM
jgi:hypothetical protein